MNHAQSTLPKELTRHNRWVILANVSLGTFMSTLDGSIANVALPTMSGELHAPIHTVQWVLTAYLLTICATLPIMGKISDLIGRSRIYNYGFILFALGSACCGMSHLLGTLIVSRILQAHRVSCPTAKPLSLMFFRQKNGAVPWASSALSFHLDH